MSRIRRAANALIPALAALVLVGCGSTPTASGQPSSNSPSSSGYLNGVAPGKLLTCAGMGVSSFMPKIAVEVRRQEKLVKKIADATAPHLGRNPLYGIAAGAWRSPGTYSAVLTQALNKINDWVKSHDAYGSADTGGGNIDPNWPSTPARLSLDVYNFNADGVYMQNLPGTKTRVTTFWADALALADDCGAGRGL